MRRPQDNLTSDLFEIPRAPMLTGGSLDCTAELRETLNEIIDSAVKRSVITDRYDLAAKMSRLLGGNDEITKAKIDAWTAASKTDWRFPFQFAAAFEAACDSTRLQELLARKRGTRILVGDQTLDAELGRIKRAQDELAGREKAIRARMRGKR